MYEQRHCSTLPVLLDALIRNRDQRRRAGEARVFPWRRHVTPSNFFALTWSLYHLQLSAMEATAAIWWTAGRELWLPRRWAARRSEARPGPSLAEMLRETRQDTYQTGDAGGEE
jgi:hypothetical protein